jgi:septum formation inhibitor-activating ATPase MinD
MEAIIEQLKNSNYDYGVAIATKAEIEAGAACGQLSLIVENA